MGTIHFNAQCSKEVLHLTFVRVALIGRARAEKPGVDGSSPSPSAKSGLRGFESLHCDHLIHSFIVIANKNSFLLTRQVVFDISVIVAFNLSNEIALIKEAKC